MLIVIRDYTAWTAKVNNPPRELEIICSRVSEFLFCNQCLHDYDTGTPI